MCRHTCRHACRLVPALRHWNPTTVPLCRVHTMASAAKFTQQDRDRLIKLFRMLGGNNASERNAARTQISNLLRRTGKTWAELPSLLSDNGPAIDAELAGHIGALGDDKT